jgi:DNA-binding MarR family transcriptional regulator
VIETDVAIELKKTYQRITQMMQVKIDEYGLTFGLLYLMILIDKNPEANQKELASKMRFTEGAMSCAVKRLLKLDMLEQIPLESDMRYNRLVLTKKGKTMIDDYKDYLPRICKNMFIGFECEELIKLHDILLKININLDKMSNQNNSQDPVE